MLLIFSDHFQGPVSCTCYPILVMASINWNENCKLFIWGNVRGVIVQSPQKLSFVCLFFNLIPPLLFSSFLSIFFWFNKKTSKSHVCNFFFFCFYVYFYGFKNRLIALRYVTTSTGGIFCFLWYYLQHFQAYCMLKKWYSSDHQIIIFSGRWRASWLLSTFRK